MFGARQISNPSMAPNRFTGRHHDPFDDYVTQILPRNMRQALRWAEAVMTTNGVYHSAIQRVLAFFLTRVVVSGDEVGSDEKVKWEEMLNDNFDVISKVMTIGMDALTYGNSFSSVLMPFTRYLICGNPRCGLDAPLSAVGENKIYNFSFSGMQYRATCPRCLYRGVWKSKDRMDRDPKRIVLKRWNPYYMHIVEEPITGYCRYWLEIPERDKQMIRSGDIDVLARTPQEFIDTVRQNVKLRFDDDNLYHFKTPWLAGFRAGGWGMPPVLPYLRQAWYNQTANRANETILSEHIVPFRVLCPEPGDPAARQANDPSRIINLSAFTHELGQMLSDHQRDYNSWHIIPYPTRYQAWGGDAKNLASFELLDQARASLLDAIGVPVDFYKMSMQAQAVPSMVRLFKSFWAPFLHSLNRFIQEFVFTVAKLMAWEPCDTKLEDVQIVDDVQSQTAKLQLMSMQQISPTTGMRTIGSDFRDEARQRLDDEAYLQELQEKKEKETTGKFTQQNLLPTPAQATAQAVQQQQQGGQGGGAAPPGGAAGGAPGGGNTSGDPGTQAPAGMPPGLPPAPTENISLQDLNAQAQSLAQQMQLWPTGQVQSTMRTLKAQNPTLWERVRSLREDMSRQLRNQGAQMMSQQQQQQ